MSGSTSLANAINSGRDQATALANVCKNPIISAEAKETTGKGYDITQRWEAANEVYTSIQNKNLLSFYGQATRISIVVSGTRYDGFRVTYADGSMETWMVIPGSQYTSAKLFDQPPPNSLTAPTKSGCGK